MYFAFYFRTLMNKLQELFSPVAKKSAIFPHLLKYRLHLCPCFGSRLHLRQSHGPSPGSTRTQPCLSSYTMECALMPGASGLAASSTSSHSFSTLRITGAGLADTIVCRKRPYRLAIHEHGRRGANSPEASMGLCPIHDPAAGTGSSRANNHMHLPIAQQKTA